MLDKQYITTISRALSNGVRHSASIVVTRPRSGDPESNLIEVLMAKRSSHMRSFSAAWTFPGGVFDPWDETVIPTISSISKTERTLAVSRVCGLRELFEETGVLLLAAHDTAKQKLSAAQRSEWQHRIQKDASELGSMLQHLGESSVPCQLGIDRLEHITTFITPVLEKRRYITDFFLAKSAPGEITDSDVATLNDAESVELRWITPSEALELNAAGQFKFLPPQYCILQELAQLSEKTSEENGASYFAGSGMLLHPKLPILPHPVLIGDGVLKLAYPGDEEHCDFPGRPGDRRRIECGLPMGTKGFKTEVNLKSTNILFNHSSNL